GAAVQICKRTACATPIWVTATRSSAPVFTSRLQSAPGKLAKHKRSFDSPFIPLALDRFLQASSSMRRKNWLSARGNGETPARAARLRGPKRKAPADADALGVPY